jgi:hypothetical protein
VRPACNAELWGCNRRTGMAVHLTRALLADPDILILSDPVVHHNPDEVRSGSSLPRPPSASLGLPRPPSASLGLPRPPSASLCLSHARTRMRAQGTRHRVTESWGRNDPSDRLDGSHEGLQGEAGRRGQ